MRRIDRALCLLCILALLLASCWGEGSQQEEADYNLYFLSADGGAHGPALDTEPYLAETGGNTPTPSELVRALIQGPQSEGLASPFPAGLALRWWEWDPEQEGNLMIGLSEQYSQLSGISLTLADYCIVLTLSQLDGVETVEIQSESYGGNYRSHQLLSAEEAVLWDELALDGQGGRESVSSRPET